MKIAILTILLLLSSLSNASPKSLCEEDDRELSYNNKVGKVVKKLSDPNGCTVTLISDSCAITAGHCIDYLRYVKFELNDGKIDPHNVYEVDQSSIRFSNNFTFDWAVFNIKRNAHTNKLPGEVYGHYHISHERPSLYEPAVITSFGNDTRIERNYLQQVAFGEIMPGKVRRKATVFHNIDTTGGSSGAAIILLKTNKIIGVHSKGGCDKGFANFGNFIGEVPEFKQAIQYCISQ